MTATTFREVDAVFQAPTFIVNLNSGARKIVVVTHAATPRIANK